MTLWRGIDEVVSPTGHRFRLVNVPFYYVGVIDTLLNSLSGK